MPGWPGWPVRDPGARAGVLRKAQPPPAANHKVRGIQRDGPAMAACRSARINSRGERSGN